MTRNLLQATDYALMTKAGFTDGLSRYVQSNCSCTLTDEGFRIYRAPNLTRSENGDTMWGGLVLKPLNIDANFFQKGHTYVLMFDVKGQTTNASEVNWSNNCGWTGGGLNPSPSNVTVINPVKANFQSSEWLPFSYKWTINDDVYKTCTSSYSSFVAGTVYPSYRDFKFGFSYADTGSLGSDIYIRNIRLFDITDVGKFSVTKEGQAIDGAIKEMESIGVANVFKYGEIRANNFIED